MRPALNPQEAFALAQEHHRAGRLTEAEAIYRQLLAAMPESPGALHSLGVLAHQVGKLDLALALEQRAIAAAPRNSAFYSNLGLLLTDMLRLEEAAAACQQAIALDAGNFEAHYNLGNALRDLGDNSGARIGYETALRLRPDGLEPMHNLGNLWLSLGRIDTAMQCLRRAHAINPANWVVHSSLLFAMSYDPEAGAEAIAEESRRWARRHADPWKAEWGPHTHERSPERKLRVGYVSADFREHPVGRHALTLLREHDREHFAAFCYSGFPKADGMTARLRSLAEGWCETAGLNDARLAEQIRADGIDILVDLALHSANHRLAVFARKPAPVQVTFAGYPGTTGLEAIDYRLTDSWLDPLPADDALYREVSVRLPDSFWCFDPFDEEPAVNELPAATNGFVTFGCLNKFAKVNDRVLALWAQVLGTVPDSRMILLCPEGPARPATIEHFARNGVSRDKLAFVDKMSRLEYLACHQRLDVALDTFPYNGHSSTCDALWMGVPMVTLTGATVVGRGGKSILSSLGLGEWVASEAEEFVGIAARLAGDLARLAEWRATLRGRLRESPLMDAPRFARGVEGAYRTMWRRWCSEGS